MVGALVAAFAVLPSRGQQPVPGDQAQVDAVIEQSGFPVISNAVFVRWSSAFSRSVLWSNLYQHVPAARTAELLAAMGATVSVGFVAGQPAVAAELLGGWLVELRRVLTAEPVLHGDETSGRVIKALWWFSSSQRSCRCG